MSDKASEASQASGKSELQRQQLALQALRNWKSYWKGASLGAAGGALVAGCLLAAGSDTDTLNILALFLISIGLGVQIQFQKKGSEGLWALEASSLAASPYGITYRAFGLLVGGLFVGAAGWMLVIVIVCAAWAVSCFEAGRLVPQSNSGELLAWFLLGAAWTAFGWRAIVASVERELDNSSAKIARETGVGGTEAQAAHRN